MPKKQRNFSAIWLRTLAFRIRRTDWLARNFDNRSVRFDVEREASIPIKSAKEFNQKFEYVDRVRADRRALNGEVRHRTLTQYAKIAGPLGPHEKVAFGLYHVDEDKPYKHVPLTKRDAELLTVFLSEELTYRGSIHGVIHDVGIEELWFHLRRTGSKELVRCEFSEDLYDDVHDACQHRHALIYVHGALTVRRVDRSITSAYATRIKVAPHLSDERYRNFFGAQPGYGGDLSSEDALDYGWHD